MAPSVGGGAKRGELSALFKHDDAARGLCKETELRDAATKMKKEIKASADALGKSLADFAVRIATA